MHSPAGRPRAKISASSSKKPFELQIQPYQYLDLRAGYGTLLGALWENRSPYAGAVLTLNTGVYPSAVKESSLWQILERDPSPKYYLSARACRGILRRADEREKPLPPELKEALEIQAGLTKGKKPIRQTAFHINQREETIETGDITSALLATSNMQMQTFVAGFSAGAGKSAGGIGYGEDLAPTLKGSPSGNSMPSILCLNDQGGQVMECSENVTGTLRAQEHNHQPLILSKEKESFRAQPTIDNTESDPSELACRRSLLFENHGIDSRYTGPHEVSPTLSARAGTGGNNLPLTMCIAGNIIDRQPENGGNGMGYQSDISYTLTAMDRHAVYARQRVDEFQNSPVVSTESARQRKNATDLVYQKTVGTLTASGRREPKAQYVEQGRLALETPLLIRRLTPLECERLQGFPDYWTALPGASDSARYQALGNSVAIPCVEFVLQGIAAVLRAS